jgi:hypothetical protein
MENGQMNVEKKLDILEVLTRSVVFQENEEISKRLSQYRSDDVQWVLNMLADMFEQLQDSLELEAYNNRHL